MKSNISTRLLKILKITTVCFLFLSGCNALTHDPYKSDLNTKAFTTPTGYSNQELKSLPQPAGKILASVYQFRDQTGQYKEKDNGSSFSTAVTQGATAILLQTLEESSWFIPLEREGLQDLLTERKIFRSANKKNKKNNISALRHAKLILQGGITGYDTNIKTGGKGIEYFGISVGNQYREDVVTVHLRAVDVNTGQIMLSVSASKRLISQEIRTGLFRYVKYKRLLGFESGMTTNEPAHLCVIDTIEKAVHDLIIKGIIKGIWNLENTKDMNHPAILAYKNMLKGEVDPRFVKHHQNESDTDIF